MPFINGTVLAPLFARKFDFRLLEKIQVQIGMMLVWEQAQFYLFYQFNFSMQKLSTMNLYKTIVTYEALFGFYQPRKCQSF